jgi:hypothetical protein
MRLPKQTGMKILTPPPDQVVRWGSSAFVIFTTEGEGSAQ